MNHASGFAELQLRLPEDLVRFAEEQVKQGRFQDVTALVENLLRSQFEQKQFEQWALQAELDGDEESEENTLSHEEFWAEMEQRLALKRAQKAA